MDWLDNIKVLKMRSGMTNDELASKSQIPVGTLNKLLSGQTGSVKLATLISLAEAFDVSLVELIGCKDDSDISDEEYGIIKKLREVDAASYDRIIDIIEREYKLALRRRRTSAFVLDDENTRQLILYNTPVSAGVGNYLEDQSVSHLTLTLNERTERADFALRVSGDSMEPKFSDGDIVIVESGSYIENGDIGIFILNGEGYIKKYGKDRLISLNPRYKDILISPSDSFECKGTVIGKVKNN